MDLNSRSLLPLMMGRDWWDTFDCPAFIMDQRFGSQLTDEDLLPETLFRGFYIKPRTHANRLASGRSQVSNDDKEFIVSLNVNQFKPDELQVKVLDNCVVIHGKHEERSDDHGLVSREFTRKYMLPNSCEMETVSSSLSPDGVLTITAPKKALDAPTRKEREIKIAKESTEAVEG